MSAGVLATTLTDTSEARFARELQEYRQSWEKRIQHTLDARDTWTFLNHILDRALQYPPGNTNRDRLMIEVTAMFEAARRLSLTCGGEIGLPNDRPSYRPLERSAMRVVNLFLSFDATTDSDIHQTAMLYGPAGSGKTVTAQLIAYEVREKLKELYRKRLDRLPGRQDIKAKEDPKFVTVYFVDALTLRASHPTTWVNKLQNTMSCIDYIAKFEDRFRAETDAADIGVRSISILILDNFETLFMTSPEIASNPRPARQSQQISSFQYRSLATPMRIAGSTAAKILYKNGGLSTTKGNRVRTSTGAKPPTGGKATTSNTPILTKGNLPASLNKNQTKRQAGLTPSRVEILSVKDHKTFEVARIAAREGLIALFGPENLHTSFPNTRIIFNVRYPWFLPPQIAAPLSENQQQIFIDLPARRMRYYYLRSRLISLIIDNTLALLREVVALNN